MTGGERTGKPFERLVAVLFGGITVADLQRPIEITRNVVLQGKTTQHEIDVFWRVPIGNIFHEVVIQAKDWATPVHQGEALKFKAVLDDLPHQPRGIMVSRVGFQDGARAVAKANGILLFEVESRPMTDLRRLEVTTASIMTLSVVARPAVVVGPEARDAAPGQDLFIRHDIWFAEDVDLNFGMDQAPPDPDAATRELTSKRHGFGGLWLVTPNGDKTQFSTFIQEYIKDAARSNAQDWSAVHRFKERVHVETKSGEVLVRGVHTIEVMFKVRHVSGHHPWREVDKDNYIVQNVLTGTHTVVKVPKAITLQLGERTDNKPL